MESYEFDMQQPSSTDFGEYTQMQNHEMQNEYQVNSEYLAEQYRVSQLQEMQHMNKRLHEHKHQLNQKS